VFSPIYRCAGRGGRASAPKVRGRASPGRWAPTPGRPAPLRWFTPPERIDRRPQPPNWASMPNGPAAGTLRALASTSPAPRFGPSPPLAASRLRSLPLLLVGASVLARARGWRPANANASRHRAGGQPRGAEDGLPSKTRPRAMTTGPAALGAWAVQCHARSVPAAGPRRHPCRRVAEPAARSRPGSAAPSGPRWRLRRPDRRPLRGRSGGCAARIGGPFGAAETALSLTFKRDSTAKPPRIPRVDASLR